MCSTGSKRRSPAYLSIPCAAVGRRNCWILEIREYREVFFKPYRIIYRVMNENVYVPVIADGRRDMRTLLERRLLLA